MEKKFSINFIRHGDTDYKETKKTEPKNVVGLTEIDLTELGVEQIKDVSKKLIEEITENNGEVILWSSPARRAQDSEDIITKELISKGIKIHKKKISSILGPIKSDYVAEENQIRDNMCRFFKWVNYVAKRCINEGKKIYVISFSHYEFLNPIMTDIFNFNIKKGEGYQKAEKMSLSFFYDEKRDSVLIDAEIRGIKIKNIYFDSNNKKFKKLEDLS